MTSQHAAAAHDDDERHAFQGITADQFKANFRNHPAGVTLVTADAPTGPVALTASSVFSVSVDPPLFVFSLSNLSSSTPKVLASDTVVVHLLEAEHLPIALLGATTGIDRFADTDSWHRLETGEPVFDGVPNWIRGRIVNRLEAGGSTVVVVHAIESGLPDGYAAGSPLVYHARTWHQLGGHSRLD